MQIKNDSLFNDFLEHLDLEGNNDIILSAPFGTGKTYFLREDFVPKTIDRYNVLHLYPVNYSVSSNEDIFETVKYDILFELMLNHKEEIQKQEDLELSKGLAIQLYIQNNFNGLDFLQQIFKATSKLGKSISDVVDLFKLEKEKYDSFYEALKANEYDTIKTYLESFESGKGAKEFDAISVLISEVLERLKGERSDNHRKENILIIDDLDRIDPEHIFRIFNVLSAHRDYHTSKNKFGFDKVILVCDVENIRRIYEHRYGRSVDFQGYINKFYSRSIYEFDNRRYIKDSLRNYLDNLEYTETSNRDYAHYWLSSSRGDGFYVVVHTFLQIFVMKGLLSLRSLKNITKLTIPSKQLYDRKNQGYYLSIFNYELLVLIGYLLTFFGSRENFKEALHSLAQNTEDGDLLSLGIDSHSSRMIHRSLIQMIINVVVMNDNKEEGDYKFKIWDSELEVDYKINSYMYDTKVFVNLSVIDERFDILNVLRLLDKAINIVENRRLLS